MANNFITFEGGEGSGKSTQARLLAERLRGLGHEAVLTREPGGPPLAEKIRALLLDEKPASPEAEFLLFAAARAEHLAVIIEPALHRGAYVICDRYIDSTRVYQSHLGKVAMHFIRSVEDATISGFIPALTLVLDVSSNVGIGRATTRGNLNRFDAREHDWHRDVCAAFRAVALAEPARCALIDGNRDPATVESEIWRTVQQRLKLP